MKTTFLTTAFLALGVASAGAQQAAPGQPQTPQQTPTCAEALPQIEGLIVQAEQAGIETETAQAHVATASSAQASGDEGGCIEALVLAQNDVLGRVQESGPMNGEADRSTQ